MPETEHYIQYIFSYTHTPFYLKEELLVGISELSALLLMHFGAIVK